MAIIPKKEICPVCGRPIRGDVRIKIKDNVELCKVCSSEIEMDSSMIPNMTVDDIKTHLAYRKENRQKMEQFKMTWGAQAGAYILRADLYLRLWYCTNERSDRNPPLFDFKDLKSAVYLEDGEPAAEIETGFKSMFAEKTAPTLVQSMKIIIDVDNYYIHQIVIETIAPGTGMTTGTMQYKMNRKNIQDMMECLKNIQDYAKMPRPDENEEAEVIPPEDEEVVTDDGQEQIPADGQEQIPAEEQEQITAGGQAQIPENPTEDTAYEVPETESAAETCEVPEPESAEGTCDAAGEEPEEASADNSVETEGPAAETSAEPESGAEADESAEPEDGDGRIRRRGRNRKKE